MQVYVTDKREILVRCIKSVRTLCTCGMRYNKAITYVANAFSLTKNETKILIERTIK